MELSSDPYPVSDEQYFVYGEQQNASYLRPKYLAATLQLSEMADVSVLLLNPETVGRLLRITANTQCVAALPSPAMTP
jgi:hypothetical protein